LARSERVGSPFQDLRWSLYYEYEAYRNPTASAIAAVLGYLQARYFGQPGFLRVNGKPVVFVYAEPGDGCDMVARWAQANTQLGDAVYVVLKVFPGFANCADHPDSWHQYAPAGSYDSQGTYSATISPGFWQ